MDVRRATGPDRETLLALWDEWNAGTPLPPWAPADARAGTAAALDESIARGTAVVAEREGRAIGFAAALPRGPAVLELTELYVRPDARREGIAGALVRALLTAAGTGAGHVLVSTAAENDGARRLYERWGFRVHAVDLVVARDELERRLEGESG